MNYDPSAISETTKYRRIVYSGAYQSESNEIQMTVLKNDLIFFNGTGSDQTSYYTNPDTPLNILGIPITGTDNETIEYYWLESIDSATWHAVWGTDGTTHTSDPIPQTTYYQREAIIKNDLGYQVFQARSNSVVAYVYDPLSSNVICCDQTVYGVAVPSKNWWKCSNWWASTYPLFLEYEHRQFNLCYDRYDNQQWGLPYSSKWLYR
jgi:hypothetical protein